MNTKDAVKRCFGNIIDADGNLFAGGRYLAYGKGQPAIGLDGVFSAEDLVVLAEYMRASQQEHGE